MTTPHFEAEMEMMADHLEKGDEVFALACGGKLQTCFTNPEHLASECLRCQGKFHAGIKLLGGKVKVVQQSLDPEVSYPEIPDSFENIEELKSFRIGNLDLGMCSASTLISRMNREHRLDTKLHSGIVRRELSTAFYLYQSSLELIRKIHPDRVYLFNGRFTSSLPVINACEAEKIPYFTHDRGGRLNSYYLIENATPHNLDYATQDIRDFWMKFPEDQAVLLGSRFYQDRRKRVEHCWVSYTKAQEEGILPKNFDPTKRNFAFFNTTIEEYAAVRERPRQLFFYEDECDAMERIATAFKHDPSVQFYLRVHPNQRGPENSQSRDIAELGRRVPNLTIIPAESEVDSYSLMEVCDTILTFGSTMGAEACFWGKPSILLGRAYYEAFDCSHSPTTHEEVIRLLQRTPEPKPRLGAIKYGLWEAERGIAFKRFVPNALFSGLYNGKRVRAPFPLRAWIVLIRLLEQPRLARVMGFFRKKS